MKPELISLAVVAAAMVSGCAPSRGDALMRVSFAENNRPSSVKVISETPPGHDYGASARSMIFDLRWTEVAAGDYMIHIYFEGYGEYMLEMREATPEDPVGPADE